MAGEIERIRELCKLKKIRFYRLESDLGYGNGYLNPKKAQTVSHARLLEIAKYLDVPVSEITGESENAAPWDGLTENERRILEAYRSDPEARARIDFEIERYEKKKTAPKE